MGRPESRTRRTPHVSIARLITTAISTSALFAGAAPALAQPFDLRDGQGRVTHFDAPDQAAATRLNDTLSGLIHGSEVSRVTTQLLAPPAVTAACGDAATGCWAVSGGIYTITVPLGDAGPAIFTHEYGHHIEHTRRTNPGTFGSGVQGWWKARGMDSLIQSGQVSLTYSLGWFRSASEIFAEDYALLNDPNRVWRMPIPAPTAEVLAALRADLVGATPATTPPIVAPGSQPAAPGQPGVPSNPPTSVAPATPGTPPKSGPDASQAVRRSGRLAARQSVALPFSVPAWGGGIAVGVRLSGGARVTSARGDIRCDGRALGGRSGRAKQPISFRVAHPGPANCELVLGRAAGSVKFTATIRVTSPASR